MDAGAAMVRAADIALNVAEVRERIAEAARRAGRDPADVTLVAVTKTVGPSEVRALLDGGVLDIGENRAQELRSKQTALGETTARWHFVGHLQTNKVKDVVGRAALIHSVDSEHLLRAIDARARRLGFSQEVLIEVNVSGEIAKYGVDPAGARELCRVAAHYENIEVKGLMTMAPLVEPEGTRPVFAALKRLFDQLASRGYASVQMDMLSAGMSNDFEVAIEEGATCIRVGSALFEHRRQG